MMIKIAKTEYPVHELIRNRWSPSSFDNRMVEKDKIQLLFEAARWAASAHNEQPWRFVYATKDDPEDFNKLLGCLNEGNRIWAATAPMLILAIFKNHMSKDNKSNRHAHHDLGLAMGNIMMEATAIGLHLHVIGGFDDEKAQAEYGIPSEFTIAAMVAVGYPGKPDALPDKFKERDVTPRTRKKIEEFAFKGVFSK